jgi:hypothetical protein
MVCDAGARSSSQRGAAGSMAGALPHIVFYFDGSARLAQTGNLKSLARSPLTAESCASTRA